MATDLVVVDGVRVERGAFALGISRWVVPAGAVVGVVGANGAGKTTLLHLLAGFVRPDAGAVRVLGHDPLRDVVAARSVLGFMADDMPLFSLRIDRLLALLSGYWPTWDPGWVKTLAKRFEIDPRRHVSHLSKGEGTRLRLVVAMAFRPRVLVLDEPATGLDLHGRRALLESVVELAGDEERAVIVSTHDLRDVERICDRVLALDRGRVVADGPLDEVAGPGRSLEQVILGAGGAP